MDNKETIEYEDDESENIWNAVSCNDIEYMKSYYANEGKPNRKLGHDISLIMLALELEYYEMFELLKQNGERIFENEVKKYKQIMVAYLYEDEITKNVRRKNVI